MGLNQEEKKHLKAVLDKCEAALTGKPTLAKIFGRTWRGEFRKRILSVGLLLEAGFPEAYCPFCFLDIPGDYHQRLEEGATIILARLKGWARKDFVSRLRSRGPASAVEELLLARGFVQEFGDIEPPVGNRAESRPEFTVSVGGQCIAIEARGLMNSTRVQQLNEESWRSGQHYWVSADPVIGDPVRVRRALAEKMLESADDSPRIIVLTLYSAFDALGGLDLARQMALRPQSFGIPEAKFPLAVGLASHRLLQGIWFNDAVVQKLGFSADITDRFRTAIKNSLYPRVDGVLLHEGMSEEEQNSVIWKT